MWSLILVFGVALVIFTVMVGVAVGKRGMPLTAGLLLAFTISCGYVGVTAPIAGMICGNNTIC